MDSDVLTVKEVAELLRVNETTVKKWKREGKLRFHRLGDHTIRFLRSDVLEFVKSNGQGGEVK